MILTKLKFMVMTTCAVLVLTSSSKSMNDDANKNEHPHIRSILLKDAYEKQLHDQKMKEKQSHSKDQHHHHKSKHHHDNKEKK